MSGDQGDRELESTDRVGGGVGPFLGGIASGMVLLGIIWVIMTGGSNGGSGSDGQAGEPASGGATSSQPDASGGSVNDTAERAPANQPPTTLDRCTTASRRLEVPLRDGRAAIGQWAVHVGAMNQLVVGALTLSQATAFWNQTRIAAYRRIGEFDTAERALERKGIDCPSPDLLGTASSPELRACSQHVAAEADQLDAARTAITTWSHHVRAMDMLRAGKLSPTKATQMWLAMWQRGKDEIARFAHAARTTIHTPGCDGSAVPQPSGAGAQDHGSAPASPSGSPMQMN